MSKLRTAIGPHDHVQGPADAPLTLVEYGDFECPHCGRAHHFIKQLQRQFGKQLRFVYRHFPLTQMHPYAASAAETSEFAGAHGKFWQMHDLLYENQEQLGIDLYMELAEELGLSQPTLRSALGSGEFAAKVRHDFSGGVRSGVNGTPSFFINGERFDGAVEDLADALQQELQRAA
ncbi:MAG: DsbA family protein [Terriglobales bacterium]|jgi:protein-disulfide isomerase